MRDQSTYIRNSFEAVQEHLILGGFFAALVVLVFIGNWRATIIAAIAIPTSIISTYTLMWMMGFTLNNMTMLALTLCVGIVIDDAVVVLENIFRFIEEKGVEPMRAAREATADIGLAVMATTLSLVIIFLPVAFMGGIVGTLHEQLRLHLSLCHHGVAAGELHADADALRPLSQGSCCLRRDTMRKQPRAVGSTAGSIATTRRCWFGR